MLLTANASDMDPVFVPHLDKELRKVVDFYQSKKRSLDHEVELVHGQIQAAEDEFEMSGEDDADVSNEDEPEQGHNLEVPAAKRTAPWQIHGNRRRSNTSMSDFEGSPDRSTDTYAIHRRWVNTFGKRGTFHRTRYDMTESDTDGADSQLGALSVRGGTGVWTVQDEYAIDMRLTLKRKLIELYTMLCELKQYVNLNLTGMTKILKKYDKITSSNLRDRYLEQVVKIKYPFRPEATERLDERVEDIVHMFARVAARGDEDLARQQLRLHLREEVVWHRNTVWREMIQIERRAQAASLEMGHMATATGPLLAEPGPENVSLRMPWGQVVLPTYMTLGLLQLIASILLFVALLKFPPLHFFEDVEKQNCFAMLVLCTCLWVTEVIPLFVTSLLVPFLIVTLRVLRTDRGERLTAPDASKWIFQQMFAPNVSLLLGGFTLAAALSKYGIDKVLATRVLRFAGSRPSTVLLAHMLVACFASMWISNVAAPVLMFSLVQPILRTLPPRSPYAASLVMGIALASNIGGQTSPIASPQNLIALEYMKEPLGWLQWFAITIPVSGISLLLLWLLLLWSFGTGRGVWIKRIPEPNEPFHATQWFISAVCLGTIALWCLERNFEWIVGDMAIIALLPLVLFFGTGILSKEDFNNFLWTIVFLAMGGIALGKGVSSSGLLASLDALVQSLVTGLPLWGILALLVTIGLVVATFISHTIAAVLLVPIAAQMGESLSSPHASLLIMATTLTSSAAMGLPISGFPNMTAINLEDEVGQRYVSVRTFLKVGIPASILAALTITTVGYMIMLVLGL